ncbi:hypothetical protein QM857_03995 [Streptococcus infantis]|uniref:Exosortase n=2 Tax=Streptococcus TaxID=1301 RepID=E8KDC9_9STRE|nr:MULTISPECIES: hypothetical protein [Streptococcus]EFX40027.1 hypothetical protein HMPREF9180_1484 [Streptococcus peroris ATCC 700780]
MDKGFTSKGTIEMSKLQKSFLKYIKRKPSFKDIMLCSALLLLAIALLLFSEKIFDENAAPFGTMVSLGIVILVEILAVRNK